MRGVYFNHDVKRIVQESLYGCMLNVYYNTGQIYPVRCCIDDGWTISNLHDGPQLVFLKQHLAHAFHLYFHQWSAHQVAISTTALIIKLAL